MTPVSETTAPPVSGGPLLDPSEPVAIIGGGILGIALGYFLARRGIRCEIFEASPVMGGLAGPRILDDGTAVDRFYHTILSSDAHLASLCAELGIDGQLRFRRTRSAFYIDGGLYSMNSLVEFLGFRPLTPLQRVALGVTVARAQFYRDWKALESVTLRDWLTTLGGRRVFERLWEPMLKAKFDGDYDQIPATWMWSRLVRMKSTRQGANQVEQAGHLIGGYWTLLAAMLSRIEGAGGKLHLKCPVSQIVIDAGKVAGLQVLGQFRPYSQVVTTMQGPVSAALMPGAPAEYRDALARIPYLGVVCALMVLDRPLSGTWTVNIAEPGIPLTGVIETTTYIDPRHVGGHHLVYLPKYTRPGSPWLAMGDDEIRRSWVDAVKRMFPAFSEEWIRYFLVHRERYVEPLRPIGSPDLPGAEAPVAGLYLATTAQIYPALTNGESVTRHAAKTAELVAGDRALMART